MYFYILIFTLIDLSIFLPKYQNSVSLCFQEFAILMNPMVSLWLLSTGVFCMPLYIPYSLTGKWHLGRGICKLWLVMDYLLCAASVFNIVLISYDRFLSVTKAVSTLFRAPPWMVIFINLCYVDKPRFDEDKTPQKYVAIFRCFAARWDEYFALSMLQCRASQPGLFSQFLLQAAVVLLPEKKQSRG